jgi:uncharacterized protein (DUF983 family)
MMSEKKYPTDRQKSAKSNIAAGKKEEIKRFRNGSKHSHISLTSSVLGNRCPRCRHGRLFMFKNPYRFKNGLKMHQNCPICDQDFQIEPGFYIGALWTSFPAVVLLMAIMAGFSIGIFNVPPEWSIIAITAILVALQPMLIRFGRSVWIHIFVRQEQINKS